MGEHVATMVQLIVGGHVLAILNDQRYVCPIGWAAGFASSKEKVARAGSGLEFGAKQQLANSSWYLSANSFYSRFFRPWKEKRVATNILESVK